MKYAKKGIPCTLGEQEGEREKRYCCYRTKECWGKTSTTSHGTSHCRMSPPTVRPIGEITPDLYMISKFLWLYSLPSCHITNFMTTAWDIVNRKWKTQILGKPCIDTATTVALYKRSLMYLNFHTWISYNYYDVAVVVVLIFRCVFASPVVVQHCILYVQRYFIKVQLQRP